VSEGEKSWGKKKKKKATSKKNIKETESGEPKRLVEKEKVNGGGGDQLRNQSRKKPRGRVG